MKIVILNGTQIKGCTYNMKQLFLKALQDGHEVKEYVFPQDCPVFCTGCKRCFCADISICPHANYTMPIWDSITWADLIVITSPNYLFGPTAQIKAILDHYGTKWMAHSPEKALFSKQAVIITNAIGAGMKNVIRVIRSSLSFWGISHISVVKQALFDTNWELVTDRRKTHIAKQCQHIATRISRRYGKAKTSLTIKVRFFGFKIVQKMIHRSELKKGHGETKDHQYWQAKGWLSGGKPWK